MNNKKTIEIGVKYIAKHTDQIQIELASQACEKELYQSLDDTGIEFLIYSVSPTDYEFSVVYPEGIVIHSLSDDDDKRFNSRSDGYTSLVLFRRIGTRICIRLDEHTTLKDFSRFAKNPIIFQYEEESKFRLSSEQCWQFYRGEEYRQTIMTQPNTVPDSLIALMGVVDCNDPESALDIKRLKGQANYAKFRIEEFMKNPMSSQLRDTLHSYLHTIGYFIGNLQQAKVRTRRKPVLEDLRKDYLIDHLSQLISSKEMSMLNQKATESAVKRIKELYPDTANEISAVSSDSIMKQLVKYPFHKDISIIFDSKVQTNIPMNPCSKCQGRSQIKPIKHNNNSTRWTVECVKCENALERSNWQARGHGAVAIWNKNNPCDNSTLNKVPFLELDGLTRQEVKEKLAAMNKYADIKGEHIKALERESTPSQRVWLNKQKGQLAYLSNLLIHGRAVLSHQNFLTSGHD